MPPIIEIDAVNCENSPYIRRKIHIYKESAPTRLGHRYNDDSSHKKPHYMLVCQFIVYRQAHHY